LIEAHVFSPAKTTSTVLEKVYENEQQLVNAESLFTNIVKYENDAPFDVLRKSFNSMTRFLRTMSNINEETLYNKVDDLLYKDYGMQVGFTLKGGKKNKVLTSIRAELNIMNLVVLTSYTENNNEFIASMTEKVLNNIENLQIQTSDMWSWSSKADASKIITALVNEEQFDFVTLSQQMLEEVDGSVTFTNQMKELEALAKSVNVDVMEKQFNAIYDMFVQMYKTDVVPHNLNKMRTNKSFNEAKREYFLGLLTGLYAKFINTLMNKSSSQRMKSFIAKNISVIGMYLNEEPKQVVVQGPGAEKGEQPQPTTVSNKDDILNSFLTEDLDNVEYEEQDIVGLDDEEEQDELMIELFGEE